MPRLSHLLARSELGLSLVQAGQADPDISWVSTTELRRLSPHLEGGEIVLTTGLDFTNHDPSWRDFVADLSRARIAAIGFGIGVNHAAIPQPLLLAVSTYRVALFTVPRPTPFIAVSKAVSQLLRADELKATHDAIRAQQRLLRGGAGPQDPAGVLASIADATGRQLALLRPDGSALARTAKYRDPPGEPTTQTISLDAQGALRLAVSGSEPLTPENQAVVAAGAAALGLRAHDLQAAQESTRQQWERAAEAIITGSLPPETVSILDPDLALPDRVHAIAVQGAAEDVADWRRLPHSGWERMITATTSRNDSPGLSTAWQLCSADTQSLEAALSLISWHGLDAVVGRAEPVRDARLSHHSAIGHLLTLSSTDALYQMPRTPTVIHVAERTPIFESLLAQPDTTTRAAHAVLGPLSTPSSPHLPNDEGEILKRTLTEFFLHHGQRAPTAAALSIHRNTLRDRLSRIEHLTGRSMNSPDDRAELWLALRIVGR